MSEINEKNVKNGKQTRLSELRLAGLRLRAGEDESALGIHAAKALGIPEDRVYGIRIIKKSLDARIKSAPYYVYTIDVRSDAPKMAALGNKQIEVCPIPEDTPFKLNQGKEMLLYPPVIIGAGPAGLFAALLLAKMGYHPLLIDQGKDIRSRVLDIERFWETGNLDEKSNAQFGEGGAGTFSDGKLTYRGHGVYQGIVFSELVECGAPEEILYWHKPHLGTDALRKIVPNIRRKITDFGGSVYFETELEDLVLDQEEIRAIKIRNKGEIPVHLVLLASGHSARGVYEMLFRHKIAMQPKPFAVGLRMEHPQEIINRMQYGDNAQDNLLPIADYNLTYRHKDRGVYTFCMCPGGYVINASSEKEHLVTNGMSFSPRASKRANSAVVAAVSEADFGTGALDGLIWQRAAEKAAYKLTGKSYRLPAQSLSSFLRWRTDEAGSLDFKPLANGICETDLREVLPSQVVDAIAEALMYWTKRYKECGFENAVLTGVETRTSAPVRILRKDNFESVSAWGLYPVGEGAGYAGGIVSAAIDGLKAAASIIERYAPPAVGFPDSLLLS